MSYHNYYLCIIYFAPEGQIVMVSSPPSLPPRAIFLSVLDEDRGPEFGEGAGGRAAAEAAVICKSFIYIWHLHNEAGSQWQPWLAGDRVACLQF